jgi:toxin ParE1/3/4
MRLTFLPAAKADLFEAADYYEKRKSGLGTEFLEEVTRCLGVIRQAPERLAARRYGVRKWGLDRFPYAIVFLVRENTLVIVAVAHWRRRPSYWRRRLPSQHQ